MALPLLYWMLECPQCGARRVVHDAYLEFVGAAEPAPGAGWGGRPPPERYGCLKGCTGQPRVIGSIFRPEDREMWLHEPHEPRKLSRQESEEWQRLIREAGLVKP
jgi:hypothetical protein